MPSGYVSNALDCDDTNSAINPAATEICNGVDDDCDTQVDEGFPNIDGDADADCVDPILSVCSAIDALIVAILASDNVSSQLKDLLITDKLGPAKTKYEEENINGAKGSLQGFIGLVNGQSGNGIPTALADAWIAIAQALIDAINNGTSNCTTSQGIHVPGGEIAVERAENFSGFKLYPNPTSGELTVEFNNATPGAGSIQILDLYGRTLRLETIMSGSQAYPISMYSLPAGVYLVKVLDGGEPIGMERVVKQ
jgi:hypothetical protein